jgi:hypothetical protein
MSDYSLFSNVKRLDVIQKHQEVSRKVLPSSVAIHPCSTTLLPCVCVCVCVHTHTPKRRNTRTHIHIHTHTHTHTQHIYTRTRRLQVHEKIYVCVCMYIYIYTYCLTTHLLGYFPAGARSRSVAVCQATDIGANGRRFRVPRLPRCLSSRLEGLSTWPD